MLTIFLFLGILAVILIEVISWYIPHKDFGKLKLNLDQGTMDDEDGNIIYDLEDLDE